MSFAWQVPILAVSASGYAVFNSLKEGWEKLVTFLIRPERCRYTVDDLGPVRFQSMRGDVYVREDTKLENAKGLNLECSYWKPESDNNRDRPTILYLHSSYGSKVEVLELLPSLVEVGLSVFAFDFSGCGNSEGSYVTLGSIEVHDVCIATEYLQQKYSLQNIILWGRSMGAATAISYASRDSQIKTIISDSTYSSIRDLLVSAVSQSATWLPQPVINMGITAVKKSIQSRAAFDLDSVNIKNCAAKLSPSTSILFAHASSDVIVPMDQTIAVMENFIGRKSLFTIHIENEEGGPPAHTSLRPKLFFDSAVEFIQRSYSIPSIKEDVNPIKSYSTAAKNLTTNEICSERVVVPDFDPDVFNKIISGKGTLEEVKQTTLLTGDDDLGIRIPNGEIISALLLNSSLVCIHQKNYSCGVLFSLAATFIDSTRGKAWYRTATCLYHLDHFSEAMFCVVQSEKFGGGIAAAKLRTTITNSSGYCEASESSLLSVCKIVGQYINNLEELYAMTGTPLNGEKHTPDDLRIEGNNSLKKKEYNLALTSYFQALHQLRNTTDDVLTLLKSTVMELELKLVGSFVVILLSPTSTKAYEYLMTSFISVDYNVVAIKAGKLGMSQRANASSIRKILDTARGSAGGATA